MKNYEKQSLEQKQIKNWISLAYVLLDWKNNNLKNKNIIFLI